MCGPCFLIGTPNTAPDFAPMKLDALKRLQTGIAAELAALRPAIFDKAFKGEL